MQITGVIQLGGLAHPLQIRSGTEVPAPASQDEKAQPLILLQMIEGGEQLINHLGVEGVVLVHAIQPERGVAAGVMFQLDGVELHDYFSLSYRSTLSPLHPKYPESCLLHCCIQTCRDRQPQHISRLRRVDHAVIPQPGTRIERMPLCFILLQYWLAQLLFLLLREHLALALGLLRSEERRV